MHNNAVIKYFSFVAGILAFVLSGCTAMKVFPQAARGGDTVALIVGSADGMNRSNTTAVYVPDSAPESPIDLTPGMRGIFKLYADKASSIYGAGSHADQVVSSSKHEQWVTVMVVDFPLGLPVGTGEVQITTTANYPTIGSHINDYPVQLEILQGVGMPSELRYEFGIGASQPGDLTLLEAVPHAQIEPTNPLNTAWPSYGAIELKLDVPTTMGGALDPPLIRVLVDDMSAATSSGLSSVYKHDATEQLTLMLISTTGRLKYFESRFSVILLSSDYFSIGFSGTPVLTTARYFDVNGVEVSGPPVSDYIVQLR